MHAAPQALAVRALWFVVAPAALTLLALRLLPTPFEVGAGGAAVVRLLDAHALVLGVALFSLIAALIRYWRFYLPGGRRLFPDSGLVPPATARERLRAYEGPARLLDRLAEPATCARLGERLGQAQRLALEAACARLRQALAADQPAEVELARAELERLAPQELSRPLRRRLSTLALVVSAAMAASLLRGTAGALFHVTSSSMLPTLAPGDVIVTSKLAYAGSRPPRRGELIVFQRLSTMSEAGPDDLAKRVVGLPGDRIVVNNGRLVINGWSVPRCDAGVYQVLGGETGALARLFVEFLDDHAYLVLGGGFARPFAGYEVAAGEVFVMGDNREASLDSRFWNQGRGGGVPLPAIEGRVWRRLAARRPDGRVMLGSLLGRLELGVGLPGMDVGSLERGVRKCLDEKPLVTSPPPPVNVSGN
jgi:signal peptidase I